MRGASVVCLAMASLVTAHAALGAAVHVEQFNPEGSVKQVRQLTARFSAPITTLGDPRLADPFVVTCSPAENAAGRGRWIDVREWSYDFARDLPAGVRCKVETVPNLEARDGTRVVSAAFEFETGGPAIVASLPREGAQDLDEQGRFLVALDGIADVASIEAHAHCEVAGIGEQIPVDVLEGEARDATLAAARNLRWEYGALLWRGDGDFYKPRAADEINAAEARLTVLSCRRSLPAATEIHLVWGAGVASPSGIATTADQVLAFKTRPEFTARFECGRVNAESGCLPGADMKVVFSAPIARAAAEAIRLASPTQSFAPTIESAETVDRVTFAGPFPETTALRVELPPDLADDAGRRLANAARFPLDVRTDASPPLAKFSGQFGILEASEGGVLPVTVRALESDVGARRLPAKGDIAGAKRRIDDDGEIIRWLERVRTAMAPRGRWVNEGEEGRWIEEPGNESVLGPDAPAESFVLPHSAGGTSEVVGIPLGDPGFYVVELASPRLGAALLGVQQPRYVATTALVTNLAVHFHWGAAGSLVWVTSLDEGKPVPGVDVRI